MNSIFLRRGRVQELLEGYGFSAWSIRELFDNRVIKPLRLPGKKKGYAIYSRVQIERDVLGKLQA